MTPRQFDFYPSKEDKLRSSYDTVKAAQKEKFDPLLTEKERLVTKIVDHIIETGESLITTKEFYRMGNKLGQGAFAQVCVAQHKLTGHFVAIKCLRKQDLNKEKECKKRIAQDMQIL